MYSYYKVDYYVFDKKLEKHTSHLVEGIMQTHSVKKKFFIYTLKISGKHMSFTWIIIIFQTRTILKPKIFLKDYSFHSEVKCTEIIYRVYKIRCCKWRQMQIINNQIYLRNFFNCIQMSLKTKFNLLNSTFCQINYLKNIYSTQYWNNVHMILSSLIPIKPFHLFLLQLLL